MRWFGIAMALLVGLGQNAPVVAGTAAPVAQSFEKLKSLVGEWEGLSQDGKSVRASYRMVSSGSCVMETLNTPDGSDMVTMYRMDGGRSITMDHYCSMGNQPRMRATPAAAASALDFSYVGATNLASPSAAHMHHLAMRFDDADHLTHEWTMRNAGKSQTVIFHFTRRP